MKSRPRNENRSSERGTALIEFSLVLPFLIVLTLAGLDLSRAFLAKNVLHQAAREGVRMRVVMVEPPSSDDIDRVEERVRQVAGGAGLVPSQIDVSTNSAANAGLNSVTVTAPFTFTFPGLFRFVGINLTNPMSLTATCQMRQE
jgi:Flp pilus assembly protein TadG